MIADADLPTCFRIIANYPEELKLEKDKSFLAIKDRIFKLTYTCSQSSFHELLDKILHLSEDPAIALFKI